MAWEVTETEGGGGRVHARFDGKAAAYLYLVARVDRYKEAGWRLHQFDDNRKTGLVHVVLRQRNRLKTLEAKPLAR